FTRIRSSLCAQRCLAPHPLPALFVVPSPHLTSPFLLPFCRGPIADSHPRRASMISLCATRLPCAPGPDQRRRGLIPLPCTRDFHENGRVGSTPTSGRCVGTGERARGACVDGQQVAVARGRRKGTPDTLGVPSSQGRARPLLRLSQPRAMLIMPSVRSARLPHPLMMSHAHLYNERVPHARLRPYRDVRAVLLHQVLTSRLLLLGRRLSRRPLPVPLPSPTSFRSPTPRCTRPPRNPRFPCARSPSPNPAPLLPAPARRRLSEIPPPLHLR
ncbi:hypothetical protein B0H14DRAFT_1540106, partial [Mycena olivaceomarginata]